MRIARFEHEGATRLGVVLDERVADITTDHGDDTAALIAGWPQEEMAPIIAAAPRHHLSEVRLLAPIVPRRDVIAVGRNYRDHAREFSDSGFDASEKQMVPDHPVIFSKSAGSMIGYGEAIDLSNDPTGTTDYEGEMAVVIGKRARGVAEDEALEHVFGWTIVNDVTARELQKRHVQWYVGKSPDTYCPIGPWIVTRDELPEIGQSWLRTSVNGEKRQEAPISDLIFGVERLIATITEVMTLWPGDVIATGTGQGVGIGFDPPRYLADGDVVEVSIDGIGTLMNPVVERGTP